MNNISNWFSLNELKAYFLMALGLLLYSFGFTVMLVNAGIVGGGAGGIATLLYYGVSDQIPVGVYYFIINFILIVTGIIIIGPRFGAKTIFAILYISMCLSLMQLYIPKDIMGMNDESDKLIQAILGGVCTGIGISICFSQGGSSGGTDIIAMILNKFFKVPIGRGIMLCDAIIVFSSYFVFGEVRPIVYGFVTMAVVAYTIDSVLTGTKQAIKFLIFTKDYQKIGDRIIKEANRGVSYISSQGGYTGKESKIIMVICRRTEQSKIYKIVREEDPKAFISVTSVSGVFGEGFESLNS